MIYRWIGALNYSVGESGLIFTDRFIVMNSAFLIYMSPLSERRFLKSQGLVAFILLLSFVALSGCAGSKVVKTDAATFDLNPRQDINRQIAENATRAKLNARDLTYYLGVGDVLELAVFQVPELEKTVRVNGRGEIVLPLLGILSVEGMSLPQLESLISRRLEESYLQNPQVSLFVKEYRSQQITVMGAVEKPDVYSVRQSRSVFEMLSLAGGLSKAAGDVIRVQMQRKDRVTGQLKAENLLLSLDKMIQGGSAVADVRLRGGDSILVPEAGVVFVEGAVKKPGSYKMQGETNVLKAIAMAGGVPWEGKQNKVEVIREIGGEPMAIDVNLNRVRKQKGDDVVLRDGDIVMVSFSATKRAISGFFRAAGQILGYSLN